jgi:hypothetical protein
MLQQMGYTGCMDKSQVAGMYADRCGEQHYLDDRPEPKNQDPLMSIRMGSIMENMNHKEYLVTCAKCHFEYCIRCHPSKGCPRQV